MYTSTTSQLVNAWGSWMHQRAWDFFSTDTFRHDVSLKRSENLMLRLEASLKEQQLEHTLFWVAESPKSPSQAHLHFLVQGEGANSFIYDFYQTRGLVNRRGVMQEPFDPARGASFYVSKSLSSNRVAYGISQLNLGTE